jgi:copper(I)-binding protein
MKNQKIWGVLFLGALLFLISGCGNQVAADAPNLSFHEVTVRTSTVTQNDESGDGWKTPQGPYGLGPNGIVFMQIDNQGGGADKLIKASSPQAETIQLKWMSTTGDGSRVLGVAQIDVPAKQITELKPVSYYLQMVNLKQKFKTGDKLTINLEFEKSGKKTVVAVVDNPS